MLFTVVSGTNRPGSNTRKVAGYVETLFKEKISGGDQVQLLDLQKLPEDLFVPSSYAQKPASLKPIEEMFMKSDALFIVIPEYNGSAPGVFKYFIDMMPFPAALHKKPSAFVGISLGRFAAVRSVEHMIQIWNYRQSPVFPDRVFIPFIDKAIDANGKPTDPKVLELLQGEITGFIEFSKKLLATN